MTTEEDKFMLELGYISTYFSTFDYMLNNIIFQLINIENEKVIDFFSEKLKTHGRVELYCKLLDSIPFTKTLTDKAKENISNFKIAQSERNKFMHNLWYTMDNDSHVLGEFYLKKFTSSIWSESDRIEFAKISKVKADLKELIFNQDKINVELIQAKINIKLKKDKSDQKMKIELNEIINNDLEIDEF